MKSHRRLLALAAISIAAVAVPAASASAASAPELVSGTTLGTLALTAGSGALFTTNFAPGNTASASGVLTATDTSPSWTLTAKDAGAGAGKMVAATSGCTGSDPQLANATSVKLTSLLPNVSIPSTPITISGTDQTVASASAQLLAANVFTTGYSVVLPSNQVMLTGCVYNQNVTYTLQ